MPENVTDQIVADLRQRAGTYFAARGDLRNVRIVGHTPKSDHYIYDIVIEFAQGSERVAAKVYRAGKNGGQYSRTQAKQEFNNLHYVYSLFQKRKFGGVPRPIGDYTELGAVVAEKFTGLPLQSIIMKAALLPGYADLNILTIAATRTGEWLRRFHKATADMPSTFRGDSLLEELQSLCESCRSEGLDAGAIGFILSGARAIVTRTRKALPCSAVLNDFTPLNVIVGEDGVAICDYAKMQRRGTSFQDVAMFLAAVEALEKYPFCNRGITGRVQQAFLEAYGVTAAEQSILRVLKMKALLSMFAQGRGVKESAVRKKVMWATVMKRFIQQAAHRSLAPAA